MKTVHVSASKDYEIYIGSDLICKAGSYIVSVKPQCTAVIISNDTVAPLYTQKLIKSLTLEGYSVLTYIIPDGESYKTQETYFAILSFLAQNHLTRSDLIIALGGGVVGDLTGFVAATYLRGVDYIQIPTTLLAMVDSSVGGKTAIDLPQGKNLVGAFYQPKMVLCDLDALKTLPQEIFTDGCAEVIKYAVLYDQALFTHLQNKGLEFDREYVISRCVELKRNVVCEDEFDTGSRQKLNFGHTIGHAIEANSNFTISHGRAVAMGMGIITKAAGNAGICSNEVYTNLCSVLRTFMLPSTAPMELNYTAQKLLDAALSDKKRSGSWVNLILPQDIGNCIIQKTDISSLKAIIESGM